MNVSLNFTPAEEKLIRLALCPSGEPGEHRNAADKLFASLRRRGIEAETLISAAQPARIDCPGDPGSFKLPFGKFKGQPLSSVPMWYLSWALDNWDNAPLVTHAISRFLKSEGVV